MGRIVLGSGELYVLDSTAMVEGALPADTVIETDANKIGDIKGGASIEYTAEYYTAISDNGKSKKTVLTKENAVLKAGVMTFIGDTLKKLTQTARVTTTSSKRTVKIGGAGNQDGKKYIVRFVHKDEEDGDIRLTVVGQQNAGLTITFEPEKETVINAEFTAFPELDSEGTLIIYEEEIPSTPSGT